MRRHMNVRKDVGRCMDVRKGMRRCRNVRKGVGREGSFSIPKHSAEVDCCLPPRTYVNKDMAGGEA